MQKARRHPHWTAPTACKRTVSGSISLPCSGFFSPFPHGTGSLSVSQEYLALPDGAGRFRQDFSGPAVLRILLVYNTLRLRGFHPLWLSFPEFHFMIIILYCSPTTPVSRNTTGLGSSLFARHYLGNHYYFLFLRVLRCFSSPGWLPLYGYYVFNVARLSHSEIYG